MTAPLLTWGTQFQNAAKSASTNLAYLTDLIAAVGLGTADATFLWEVKASLLSATGNPGTNYVLLGPKDASKPGRILVAAWAGTIGQCTSRLFNTNQTTPSASYVWGSYFPNALGNTVNTTHISTGTGSGMADLGAILDDDSSCVGAVSITSGTSYYTNPLSVACNAEMFVVQDASLIAVTQAGGFIAGNIFLDSTGNSVPGMVTVSANSALGILGTVSAPPYTASASLTEATGTFGSKCFYNGTRQWAQPVCVYNIVRSTFPSGADNPMNDSVHSRAYFFPILFMPQPVAGNFGLALKLRQMAFGPLPTVKEQTYNDGTGVKAVSLARFTGTYPTAGPLWLTQVAI